MNISLWGTHVYTNTEANPAFSGKGRGGGGNGGKLNVKLLLPTKYPFEA